MSRPKTLQVASAQVYYAGRERELILLATGRLILIPRPTREQRWLARIADEADPVRYAVDLAKPWWQEEWKGGLLSALQVRLKRGYTKRCERKKQEADSKLFLLSERNRYYVKRRFWRGVTVSTGRIQ